MQKYKCETCKYWNQRTGFVSINNAPVYYSGACECPKFVEEVPWSVLPADGLIYGSGDDAFVYTGRLFGCVQWTAKDDNGESLEAQIEKLKLENLQLRGELIHRDLESKSSIITVEPENDVWND